MKKLSVLLTMIILFSLTPMVLAQDEYTPLSLDLVLYSDGTVKVVFSVTISLLHTLTYGLKPSSTALGPGVNEKS